MKKIIILLLAVLFSLPLFAWKDLDYSKQGNWFICENEKQETSFDVFYLYPTLSAKDGRIFLDPNDKEGMEKVLAFVKAQTGIFAGDARIFAPFVRQLEYQEIMEYAKDKKKQREFMCGVYDAENAFRFYRKNYRNGRPFIFAGHSQGAMELYELLKRDPEISPENGFVAAYLIGLGPVTTSQMQSDFKDRQIRPAQAADDIGVIIVWNTQNRDAKGSLFSIKGGYCINPLNWKTDDTKASASENKGAFFYDYRDGSTKKVPNFCGAYADPEKGALIVDLPPDSEWDAKGFMGKGVFHMNDVWFFAENMRQNMILRVQAFQKSREK